MSETRRRPRLPVSVRLDDDVKERVEALARADDRTVSAYVNRVMRAHVDAVAPVNPAPAPRAKPAKR